MKRSVIFSRTISIVATVALVLTLTGCTAFNDYLTSLLIGEEYSSAVADAEKVTLEEEELPHTVEVTTPPPTITKEDEDEPADTVDTDRFDFDAEAIKDWQKAYKKLIDEKTALILSGDENTGVPVSAEESGCISGYYIVNINTDNVPELIIRYGTCEADFVDEVYTFADRRVIFLSDYPSGHTSYYNDPKDEFAYTVWAHMGSQYIQSMAMEDDALKFEEIFSEELTMDEGGVMGDYTDIRTLVPRAEYCSEYNPFISLPLIEYIKRSDTSSGKENEAVRNILLNTVNLNSIVYPVFGDKPARKMEKTSFRDILKAHVLHPYGDTDDNASIYDFYDLNNDGQDEMIILTDQGSYIILSYQDDEVYAYCFEYLWDNLESIDDGVMCFRDEYINEDVRMMLSFNKDQCYIRYME